MSTQGGAVRERGGCLTAYLVLIVIGSIVGVASAFSLNASIQTLQAQGVTIPEIPSWYAPATIVPVLLSLVGAYGTWTWKKWGVYALAGTIALNVILSILAGQVASGLGALVIGGGLLWFVLRNKMSMFE